jgi:peptidoglycan/LPS O-acetylase OafA/YrhL
VEFVRRWPALPWLVAAIAFWAVATQIGLNGATIVKAYPNHTFLLRHELYTVVALGLIVPAIFALPGRGVPGRVLGNRVMLYLGLISYAIYLYHLAVIDKVNGWLDHLTGAAVGTRALVYFVLGLAITVVIATVSYYALERPALRLKRLVPGRGIARGEAVVEPAPAVPAAAPSATAASTTSDTSAG